MSDEADRADQESARWLNESMNLKKPEGPEPTGFCLTCEDEVPPGHRWCNAECRDFYETHMMRRV